MQAARLLLCPRSFPLALHIALFPSPIAELAKLLTLRPDIEELAQCRVPSNTASRPVSYHTWHIMVAVND
jgi:hypothetical protein